MEKLIFKNKPNLCLLGIGLFQKTNIKISFESVHFYAKLSNYCVPELETQQYVIMCNREKYIPFSHYIFKPSITNRHA